MARAVSNQQSAISGKRWLLLAAGCWLLVAGTGCESVVRKFTRKPKHPPARPSPVISFQDYATAVTPIDRYRKHYVLFEYWNAELADELQRATMNSKRASRASREALQELAAMQELLQEPLRSSIEPAIRQRRRIDAQLRAELFTASQRETTARLLERQSRDLHREFYWRKVEDKLTGEAPPALPPPSPAGGPGGSSTERLSAQTDVTEATPGALPSDAQPQATDQAVESVD